MRPIKSVTPKNLPELGKTPKITTQIWYTDYHGPKGPDSDRVTNYSVMFISHRGSYQSY